MRFGLSIETEKVERFKKPIEAFVKERPRERLAFSAFRLTAISADLGESGIEGPITLTIALVGVSHCFPFLQVLFNR
jgi:hypothetical protein